ncbi:hypothetical protein [Pseudolactococcus reticulitermitis]|uniref:Uncharacterized protein n=1 Tax=Pseudolactococcus reticulitermitis TaxID=2025039 RepID=A0A224XA08_9LACT|nr:hypothetical protein [Lactococcus reticulitermitis]GAX46782.1 hypothetical protein RsY01_362 [Lactococcus reticulitermitis]
MKIRIQGSKVIRYIKAKDGKTYTETFDFSRHGVSNLMRRLSAVGKFDLDDEKSEKNLNYLSDLLVNNRLI